MPDAPFLRCLPFLRVTLLALLVTGAAMARAGEPLTVYAAASLTGVLEQVGAAWAATAGEPTPRIAFASSAVLARQLEAGARADVFISADQEWMDYLAGRGLIQPATRRDLLANELVLVAPRGDAVQPAGGGKPDLPALLGSGRLAVGDPDYVPAGRYSRQALASMGAWEGVANRLARAENVRAALAWVARSEAPLGIVYATDARAEPRVQVVYAFPPASHAPIRYPVAATRGAMPQAAGLIDFAAGPEGMALFRAAGFSAP